MWHQVSIVCGAIFFVSGIFKCLTLYRSFSSNLAAAKASGLPYVIVPIYVLSFPWQISKPFLIPLLKRLPAAWTDIWVPWLDLDHLWFNNYKPFKRLGTDIVISVSPQRNVLWTCNPEANHAISSRRLDFPKPTEVYGPLNTLGPTLPGTEGEEWRTLRKITGRSFHENTNRHVWFYTKDRVQMLIRDWTDNTSINHLHKDLAQLTLHVISRVCFGKEIPWPNDKSSPEAIPRNHRLSYSASLSAVFLYLPICFLVPPWLLRTLPFPAFRAARLALSEWKAYVEEIRQEKKEDLQINSSIEPDLLTVLVEASSGGTISMTALDANIFVFHAAGYETTGSTLAFALLMLACFPSAQKKLHTELDSLFRCQNSNPKSEGIAEWSYEKYFPTLVDGYTGAVLAETLRLFSVLSWIPKCTKSSQTLTIQNGTYVVPSNTLVIIAPDATHRNPKYWTTGIDDNDQSNNAHAGVNLRDFSPERWLEGETRFHPIPGSYTPFSSGPRSCIGQRFAQVEMCATLASLLCEYRIELIGTLVSTPESREGEQMGMEEGNETWEKVRKSALDAMEKHIYFEMTLKMPVEIPLRLVKRNNL